MNHKVLRYCVTAVIVSVITVIFLLIFGAFWKTDPRENLRAWVDGFFASGLLTICFGLLVLCTNGGAFDFIIYGVSRFFSLFQKDVNKVKYRTYYDFHEAKRGRHYSFVYIIVVGGVFLLVSLILLIVFANKGYIQTTE